MTIHIYIYIYMYVSMYVYVYVYIYIYIYIYVEGPSLSMRGRPAGGLLPREARIYKCIYYSFVYIYI